MNVYEERKIYDEYLEWADLPETIYDNYSEEEKAWIKESPRIVSLLNLGNQLAEFL